MLLGEVFFIAGLGLAAILLVLSPLTTVIAVKAVLGVGWIVALLVSLATFVVALGIASWADGRLGDDDDLDRTSWKGRGFAALYVVTITAFSSIPLYGTYLLFSGL